MKGAPILAGTSFPEVERFVRDAGFPAYRAKQLWGWMYDRYVVDPEKMTDLPAKLREQIKREFLAPSLAEDSHVAAPDVEKLRLKLRRRGRTPPASRLRASSA